MRFSWPAFALSFSALAAAGAPDAATPPLRFAALPLANVALILSARFRVPITITAHARAPITGDFTHLDLGAALTEAGRQAGLVARPLGPVPAAGFLLEAPPPPPRPEEVASGLADAARRRAILLRQRAVLLQAAAEPGP
jgi:hypothetical protein